MSEFRMECVNWLLASEHPSLRYMVKRDLLGEAPSPYEQNALLAQDSPISRILTELKEGRYWIAPRSIYSPKFFASHWSLLLLYEYGLPGDHPAAREAVRFVLDHTSRWLDGGAVSEIDDHEMACYYGNVLRYACHFGFAGDPTFIRMLDYLSRAKQGREWCCKHNENQPCSWGAIRTLWGLAWLPAGLQTDRTKQAMQSAADLIVNSLEMLQRINAAPQIKQHALWGKISFPLYYQCDRLFTLRTLRDAGMLHRQEILPVLRWLSALQTKQGTWRGSNPYRSRSWEFGMTKEDTDRWVTLQSLLILKDAAQFHAL